MPWAKGQSGNPRGRPKTDFSIQALCLDFTEEGVSILKAVARGEIEGCTPAARISAIKEILDRAYGRAPAPQNLTIDDKQTASDWSRDELVAILNEGRERRRIARTGSA
jgi:hypothetical protein